ncbi:MAG: endoribonuclease MazF [Candidatus Margulisiibacteriota bacterium]
MSYVPDRGDVVWMDFDPTLGHEQAKKRPALVLSPKAYNQKTSLCLVCPMTSKIKGYPFEVHVEAQASVSVVLADQVKSLDWRSRKATFKHKVTPTILKEVLDKLGVLLN